MPSSILAPPVTALLPDASSDGDDDVEMTNVTKKQDDKDELKDEDKSGPLPKINKGKGRAHAPARGNEKHDGEQREDKDADKEEGEGEVQGARVWDIPTSEEIQASFCAYLRSATPGSEALDARPVSLLTYPTIRNGL
ncbi:unnamed protein product [Peniophora sp. CBMAI 1063]|nr:unnamed protein product [Peniophora sp. CBMAI 1063]